MPLWVDIVVKLTPAFITLVVGLIASFVGYRQYKTTKDKLRLDLFSKRLEAFEKLQEFFSSLMKTGQVQEQTLGTLAQARYKSLFLFGSEMEEYFNELWKNAAEMHRLCPDLHGPGRLPPGPENKVMHDKERQLLNWNLDQMAKCHVRYAAYMRFEK